MKQFDLKKDLKAKLEKEIVNGKISKSDARKLKNKFGVKGPKNKQSPAKSGLKKYLKDE